MRREFVALPPEASLGEARRTMQLARLRHLCVVGENATLVGLVSYRDLVDALLAALEGALPREPLAQAAARPLRAAMRAAPYVARPETPASEAARRMLGLHLGCLPVCRPAAGAERLVGLLSESDLLRAAWLR
jgi:CBS domain-containing protein